MPVSGQASWRVAFCVSMIAMAIAPRSVMSSQEWSFGALKDVELATPFTVSEVKGRVLSWRRQPLQDASFDLLAGNRGLGVGTDATGSFKLDKRLLPVMPHIEYPDLKQARTYRFKASREGFHSTTGTVIVSPDAPRDSLIEIELQPGPDADDRTFDQRGNDWAKAKLPACEPAVNRNPKRGKYPGAVIDLPISIGLCAVRMPEFVAKKSPYRFMLEADASLGLDPMNCMLGLFSTPLQRREHNCLDDVPLLRADWTVWLGDEAMTRGSSPLQDHASWARNSLSKQMGYFVAEAGKKYVIEVKFLKDGSAINAANPHLVVQRTN